MNALVNTTLSPRFQQMINNMFDGNARLNPLLFSNEETYPPYSAWVDKSGDCHIEIAVSGFSKEDLKIEFDGKCLMITGERTSTENDEDVHWIKRGLARRSFTRRFEVHGKSILESANLKNGILTIVLKDDTQKITVEITE